MDNWLLLIVAIVGTIVATRFLKTIDKQAGLMDKQAGLMEQQLRQASKQFELTQRPWISPRVVLDGDLVSGDTGRYYLNVKVQLDNIGETPAVGVSVVCALHVAEYGRFHDLKDFCEEAVKASRWGDVVFPGEPWTRSLHVSGQPVDHQGRVQHASGQPVDHQSAATTDVPYYIRVIVCVVYRSSFDESTGYYMGAEHYLVRYVEGDKGRETCYPDRDAFQPRTVVPVGQLRLVYRDFPGTMSN